MINKNEMTALLPVLQSHLDLDLSDVSHASDSFYDGRFRQLRRRNSVIASIFIDSSTSHRRGSVRYKKRA